MSFKLKIIGGVMALAGLAMFGFGWPYRMLDWGGIQVMLGAVLAMGGVLLAALGFALQEVHAHIRRLLLAAGEGKGGVTEPAPAPVAGAEKTVEAASPPTPAAEPPAGKASEPALGAGGIAAAAGAAVAAGAAAVAMGRSAEAKDDLPATEPSFPPSTGFPKLDLDAFADDALARFAPVREKASSSLDDLTAKINEAVGDIDMLRKETSGRKEPEPIIDIEPVVPDEPDVEAAAMTGPGEEPEAAPGAPDPEPEAEADKAADHEEQEDAPLPAEPVVEDEDKPAVIEEQDAAEVAAETAQDEAAADDDEPAGDEANAPVTNAEGIVGVHKVGASTFTMYADGTIRAETPDGAFGFSSVADLKAYLAGDKSVARAL